ncbi:MAG: DUF554 domain-containing protein [Oscillospiraceae bacterium]|nr:DUF554 domain-containing protein [Oscillospiraceae bacterium]
MWKYFGVFCNVATVLLGSGLGLLLRRRTEGGEDPARERLPQAMMVCMGFCTVYAAASGLLGTENGTQALIVVFSMAAGLLLGWLLRIDDRLNRLGDRVLARLARAGQTGSNPAEGLVTAVLLFCIGSMTILGAFQSAANPPAALDLDCHTTLLIKSLLDFVSATCLTVSFGPSVMASALFVLLFQGLLVALAAQLQPFLERIAVMPILNCVGSLILLAIAVNLLGLKKIKTADYLPALVIPVLICWILA